MKHIAEKEIAREINVSYGRDLDTIQKRAVGIDRAPLLMVLANFATKRGRRMSAETKRLLRHHHRAAATSARHAEDLAQELRASMQKPGYLRPGSHDPFENGLRSVEFVATWKRKDSRAIGEYIERNGRSFPDVHYYVLGWILKCDPDFKCWESLSRLLKGAYDAGDIDAGKKEMKHLSAGALRKATKRRKTP